MRSLAHARACEDEQSLGTKTEASQFRDCINEAKVRPHPICTDGSREQKVSVIPLDVRRPLTRLENVKQDVKTCSAAEEPTGRTPSEPF